MSNYDSEVGNVYQYPNYDNSGYLTVNASTVVDPDGNLVEINSIIDY